MRDKILFVTALCLLLTASVLAAGSRDKLSPGDSAPGLDIEEWIKGDETSIEKGRVYIIEFWSTTCPACRKAIPRLTEFQEEYEDKGLTVIGISTEEANVVSRFVSAQRDKMDYVVAVDRRQSSHRAWMSAAGRKDIPCAFIVGKDSRLAYIGNPLDDEMEAILKKVVRGRFDPKLDKVAQPRLKAARAARKTKTWRMAEKHYKDIIELNPTVFAEVALEYFQMILVDREDRQAAYGYAREELINGTFADDYEALQMLAEMVVTDPKISSEYRDYELALEAANAAMSLAGPNDPYAISTLALVHFERGELVKAISLQKRAWMISKPRHKGSFMRVLKSYQETAERMETSRM